MGLRLMSDVVAPLEEASDHALIARWKAGDERAATLLVERHSPALARFAASLGAHENVGELVQDTLVRAFESLDGFRSDSSLRTWLFTILRRLAIDHGRSVARRRETGPPEPDQLVTTHDALDELLADETQARIRAVMGGLTRMQREVFGLRVSEGMSYKEISEVLGTTEGAARVHYHNALRAVKEGLDD